MPKTKSKQTRVAIRLNHHCRIPRCYGNRGQVIQVSAEDAAMLIERGGAVKVNGPASAQTARPEAEQPETTAKPLPETGTRPLPQQGATAETGEPTGEPVSETGSGESKTDEQPAKVKKRK